MTDPETNNNNSNDKGIELLIDKKIADAKFDIAENRLQFVLKIGAAILVLFGIIMPLYLSQQTDNKVTIAIDKMDNTIKKSEEKIDSEIVKIETKFNELAGKQLRKPEITAYIDGMNLANKKVLFDSNKKFGSKMILIKNTGDDK